MMAYILEDKETTNEEYHYAEHKYEVAEGDMFLEHLIHKGEDRFRVI